MLALHPVVTLMGVCMVRIAYRMLYEHARARITGSDAEIRRALVLGAGEAARLLLAGIHQQGWIVLGLLDDDPAKQGARIAGVPVLGPLAAVHDQAVRGAATHLVIAHAVGQRGAAARARSSWPPPTGLPVLTVPSARRTARRQRSVERVRDIEPEDLLGREPVQLDEAGIAALLRGKTVLVTGAGGSIGSELCRQVARYGPARLVLYELSEFNLYSIEQELGERFPQLPLVRLIGDVKDLAHLRADLRDVAAAGGVPRRGVQARAADGGGQRLGRAAQQHARHLARRAGRGRGRRRALRADLHRQGGEPDQRDGRHQARRRDGGLAAGRRSTPRTRFMAVRFGNVLGSQRQRDPEVQGADRDAAGR